MKVTPVSFGFPILKSLNIKLEELEELKKQDFSGVNILLKIEIDKLLKKNFNQDKIAEDIKKATNANLVKFKFIYNTESNKRSKSVSSKNDIVDKFEEYAKLNNIKYSSRVLNKIKNIQEEIRIEQQVPTEAFTLEYLSLRGAIGIKKGSGKDQIDIDFTKFNKGLIVLQGENGKGKTTIIENCHPYPCMLSRKGSLKEHFCLKDSHRILIYKTDSGVRYKIGMYISGTAQSIMTRYEVSKEVDGEWINLKHINSYETYNKFVEQTFGTKDIFLRTAFYIKEPIKELPDLAYTTKTENINLFSILAGTDYLSYISSCAKQLAKETQEKINEIKSQLKDFDNIEYRINEYQDNLKEAKDGLDKARKLIEVDKEEVEIYLEEQKKFDLAVSQYDFLRKTVNKLVTDIEYCEHKIKVLSNEIETLEQEDVELLKKQEEWFDTNMKIRKQLVNDENDSKIEILKLQGEINNRKDVISKCQKEVSEYENKIYQIEINLDFYKKQIPQNTETCPVCNAPLEKTKVRELKDQVEKINNLIEKESCEKESYNTQIIELKHIIDKNDTQELEKKLLEKNKLLINITNDLIKIDEYAAEIDIVKIRSFLTDGVKNISLKKEDLRNFQNEKAELEKMLKEYELKMESTPPDYSEKIKRLNRNIQNLQQEIAECSTKIDWYNTELIRLNDYIGSVQNIKEQIKEYNKDLNDYEIISKAFGNNGIQILELESAVPEISDIANSILQETYGDKFTLIFDTQKLTKDDKIVDDFVIKVFSSKDGRIERLDMLSSGERIWVKQALYYAFSVIRARRTGFCFKTRFLDETDGSLDTEARLKYLKMIESAHEMCNATQTILITHSSEIKDMVVQKIEL